MKLTPREQQVYDALMDYVESPGVIARRAKIHTISPSETASKYCNSLSKKGLAIRGGTPMHPKWRRADDAKARRERA